MVSRTFGGGDLVADALAGDLALELRERQQDVEREARVRLSLRRRRAFEELRASRLVITGSPDPDLLPPALAGAP